MGVLQTDRYEGADSSTSADVIAAVRQLVLIASDDLIAGILNRNGLVTGFMAMPGSRARYIVAYISRCRLWRVSVFPGVVPRHNCLHVRCFALLIARAAIHHSKYHSNCTEFFILR